MTATEEAVLSVCAIIFPADLEGQKSLAASIGNIVRLASVEKDREIVELKADNSGLLLVRQKLIEGIGIMDAENKRIREGLEEISRSREYEGFLLVSPALVEKLLENPAAGENPTSVDKNNS